MSETIACFSAKHSRGLELGSRPFACAGLKKVGSALYYSSSVNLLLGVASATFAIHSGRLVAAGFPFDALVVMAVLRHRAVPSAVMFHEPYPWGNGTFGSDPTAPRCLPALGDTASVIEEQ